MEYRRADRRFDRRIPIDFIHDGVTHRAQTRNISLGGVFVDTDVILPFGARVQLRFRLPSQADPINVLGQVRWGETGEDSELRGIGIRFEGLRARDVWAINRYLSQPV